MIETAADNFHKHKLVYIQNRREKRHNNSFSNFIDLLDFHIQAALNIHENWNFHIQKKVKKSGKIKIFCDTNFKTCIHSFGGIKSATLKRIFYIPSNHCKCLILTIFDAIIPSCSKY